jgi:plastocyanin
MRGTRPLIAIGLTVALFAVAGCGGSDEASSDTDTTATETTATETTGEETTGQTEELYATVGPGFTISLATEDGTAITTLPAGTYKVEVDDKSDAHNFHLTGPGDVDVMTEVSEVTKVDWDVDLVAGTYNYQCDPHASTMNGSFEVTG